MVCFKIYIETFFIAFKTVRGSNMIQRQTDILDLRISTTVYQWLYVCLYIYIYTKYIYVITYVDIYMCSHDIHIVHTIQKLIILLFPPRIPVILPIADHCCVRNRSVGAWSSRYSRDIMYISMRYPLVNRHSYGKSPSLSSVNWPFQWVIFNGKLLNYYY
jgi:hypothetical protein